MHIIHATPPPPLSPPPHVQEELELERTVEEELGLEEGSTQAPGPECLIAAKLLLEVMGEPHPDIALQVRGTACSKGALHAARKTLRSRACVCWCCSSIVCSATGRATCVCSRDHPATSE